MDEDVYLPGKLKDELNKLNIFEDDLIEMHQDGLFHLGRSYDEIPAKTIVCKICAGKEFNVGQGSYFTAIRCIKCGYELGVHSG